MQPVVRLDRRRETQRRNGVGRRARTFEDESERRPRFAVVRAQTASLARVRHGELERVDVGLRIRARRFELEHARRRRL